MQITEYDVGPGAYGVAIAADGAVWTSLVERGELARIDPAGTCTRIGLDSLSRPMVLTNGPDGDLWFSRGDGFLGHINRAGTISSRPVLTTSATPYGVCAGPEHTAWYTLVDHDRIGRMTLDGQTEEFPVPEGSMPSMICAASGGWSWVTLNRANAVCAINLDGKLTTYPLPTPDAAPVGIAASLDGAWFAEIGAGQIGRISPDGAIEEFPLPDRSGRPHAVATTRDGGCWATLWASSSAIRLDHDGQVIDQAHFTADAEPHGIAIAADNSVWVALETGSLAHLVGI